MNKRSIIVGVDFSEASLTASRWTAQQLANDHQLVLVHAVYIPEPPSFLRGLYPLTDQVREDARRGAEIRLNELATSLGVRHIRTEVRVGRPDEVLGIIAEEYRALLVVIGTHGERPGILRLLGSTAERVTRAARTTTLLARHLPTAASRRVLLALDESDLVQPIIDWTARMAAQHTGESIALHVVNPLLHGATIGASPSELRHAEDRIRASTEAWLKRKLSGTSLEAARVVVEFGDAGIEILAAVHRYQADLLVVGAHGARQHARGFMGSVVEFVLRNGSGPVLVVAPDQPSGAD